MIDLNRIGGSEVLVECLQLISQAVRHLLQPNAHQKLDKLKNPANWLGD
jgi:hypothetical protein